MIVSGPAKLFIDDVYAGEVQDIDFSSRPPDASKIEEQKHKGLFKPTTLWSGTTTAVINQVERWLFMRDVFDTTRKQLGA